jgi:hypothetical protein
MNILHSYSHHVVQMQHLSVVHMTQVYHPIEISSHASDNITLCRNVKKDLQLVSKFDKNYVQLGVDAMDELCAWIHEMRRRFHQEGRVIFDTSDTGADDINIDLTGVNNSLLLMIELNRIFYNL